MFYGCCQLHDISALSNWNVSKVENMSCMFAYCKQLEDITALSNWNVSNVKNMYGMFCSCQQLHDISALFNWNVFKVEDMRRMFDSCPLLPHDLQSIPSPSCLKAYFNECKHNTFRKETNQHISALQKENTELKSRLAYLEEKMDFLMSQISAPIKSQTLYTENELPQWNP
jgi:surface protein